MLNQRLQQKMLQKLSPQQILLMKLLQIPTVALDQRIKQEIENNPVLEYDEDKQVEGQEEDYNEYDDEYSSERESTQEIDISDYVDDDDIPYYKLNANNYSSDDEIRETPLVSGKGFQEHLLSQLALKNITKDQMNIGEIIIGNIDESGYLQRSLSHMVDDLAFNQSIETNVKELGEVLKIIQTLDPAGVGAKNLRECLLLQLNRMETSPDVELAINVLENYFDEFSKKHFDKIISRTKTSEEELRDAVAVILKLNPKPGSAFSSSTQQTQYVIPDFIIDNKNGELELTLNQRNMPDLKLNRTYVDMLETYTKNRKSAESTEEDKNTLAFIKQKVDSAKWFIDAINQRHNTLMVTMQAILDFQYDYFLEGDETLIKPMILKDIAEKVGLDFSTISRVANSKYVQTPYGTFLLKSFFSEAIQNDQGEEVSTREIKKILSDCIDSEDKTKPHTDEELTRILKKKGYPIARRTVAKYRDQLSIPVARLRKEI